MAGKSKFYGPFNHPDPDFLEPGYLWNGHEEDKTAFSFWCLFSAPLMVATDVRDMSNKQILLNTEAIAVNQDALSIPGDLVHSLGKGQTWTKPLSGGKSWAVVLYNSELIFGHTACLLAFTPTMLPGWNPAHTAAHVRDIWAHRDLGVFNGTFSKSYSARHSGMFIISPA